MGFKIAICGGFLVMLRFLYRYGTINKKIVTIKEKKFYKQNPNFIILTEQNEIYNVITNFENMSCYPLWFKFNVGEKIEITYYGMRFPLFGLYPNIYKIDNKRWTRELQERQKKIQNKIK